ncbi:MAG: glycoside hydrolase family 57 protein [Chrysiogenales bacterium]
MSRKTRLAILWHMHQPFYQNPQSGNFELPWLRLHALKDYYGMVHILEEFPSLRLTFNLVPSLLAGLELYHAGVSDAFQDIFRKPAASLSREDVEFLVQHFFSLNHENHIKPFRRFDFLYQKKMARLAQSATPDWQQIFSLAELRDIQVWFQLSYFDEFYKNSDPRVAALIAKGQSFSEKDKETVSAVENEILLRIVPEYKKFQDSGQIELSTSPFYHPIMPLLLDPQQGRKANPSLPAYDLEFDWEDDLRAQLNAALSLMEKTFGRRPQGIWPSEGSLSERVMLILAQMGIAWTASDEHVLSRSLPRQLERNSRFQITTPEAFYKPYRLPGNPVRIFFRDQLLSDLIGFYYQKFSAAAAAADLHRRIKDIARSSSEELTISIILDGENAWEFYPGSGRDFLREFYRQLSLDSEIETVTFSQAMDSLNLDLAKLKAGSWINANFDIWIGDREDQRAWEFLKGAKDAFSAAKNRLNQGQIEAIEELVHIAQGSDWFWWYGRENYTPDIAVFDNLFRQNLLKIYQILQQPVPEALTRPIAASVNADHLNIIQPQDYLEVIIDGKTSDFFEWQDAGRIDINSYGGAMNIANPIVKTLYFGFDHDHVFLRIDTKKDALTYFENGFSLSVSLQSERNLWQGGIYKKDQLLTLNNFSTDAQAAAGKIIEIKVPFGILGIGSGNTLELKLEWSFNGQPFQTIPAGGPIKINIPGDKAYVANWQV